MKSVSEWRLFFFLRNCHKYDSRRRHKNNQSPELKHNKSHSIADARRALENNDTSIHTHNTR